MRIYIAGPIASRKESYKQDFADAERRLMRAGETALNPAWLPQGLDDHSYMPICLSMIDACDAIYLLNGWKQSKGACLEKMYAEYQGKIILFEGGI